MGCILVPECAVRKGLLIAFVLAIAAVSVWFGRGSRDAAPAVVQAPASAPSKTAIPFADAKAILEAHQADLPAGLKGKAPTDLESAWPAWAARHDEEIRARLAQGDEDSVVNLWQYGTTFTTLPRATEQELGAGPRARAEELLIRRLDDLVTGIASPGANERLQFARQLVERHGINPATEAGQEQARVYLVKARERAIAEHARYREAAKSATYSTIYKDRGLSTDTRITVDFALDKALEAIAAKRGLAAQSVKRVAIVGPGLDFTDKAEGFDFYPPQTIQPFALVDTLGRFNLGQPDLIRVTTLDLSPRVNAHLESARLRATHREPYVVQLPLTKDDPKHQWHPDLVAYWQRFGDQIGVDSAPYPAPSPSVRMRAVAVRPGVTLSIAPQDVNIIVQRLEPLPDTERFDLIVATNILVYYDAFDQALALVNIAKMLKPGGYFITNYAVSPLPPLEPSASVVTAVFFDRQGNGDTLYCYQRR
jgi:SAM-dependent methyltransferase